MNNNYVFNCTMIPVPKGRPRLGKGRVFTPAKTKVAENRLKKAMKDWVRTKSIFPLKTACAIDVTFYVPRPKSRAKQEYPIQKPDVDNYLKLVMDAGNEILWSDDSIVVTIKASKKYSIDPMSAGITMVIQPLDITSFQ